MATSMVCVMNTRHEAWLQRVLGDDAITAAAVKLGHAKTTLARQLQRGGLSAETVIRICRAYDYSPLTGLVETGYLTPSEAAAQVQIKGLDTATTRELMDELWTRTDEGSVELMDAAGAENVVRLRPRADSYTSSIYTDLGSDGTPYAADESPDELMEGDDGYNDGP